MLMWNDVVRGLPRGIEIGTDVRNPVLSLPHDFEDVKHYGVSCSLQKIEVIIFNINPCYVGIMLGGLLVKTKQIM